MENFNEINDDELKSIYGGPHKELLLFVNMNVLSVVKLIHSIWKCMELFVDLILSVIVFVQKQKNYLKLKVGIYQTLKLLAQMM